MSETLAGSAGVRQAKRFIDVVLWNERSPDEWPLGAIIATFRERADLSPGDRALHAELLRRLLRLARSAGDLHATESLGPPPFGLTCAAATAALTVILKRAEKEELL